MNDAGEDRVPVWRRYMRFFRPDSRADVRDEIEFHIRSAADEMVAQGMTPAEAHDAARRRFGDLDRIGETLQTLSEVRERNVRLIERWHSVVQDARFGLRQLLRNPAFSIIAIATLALGIGATSAIFSVVYSVLLKPLPYANADRVVSLAQLGERDTSSFMPYGNFAAWRRGAASFAAMGTISGGGPQSLTGRGDPLPVPVFHATAGYWKALFVPPAAGRYYTDRDDREGAPPVAIISHALWVSRFGADSGVVGTSITLNGRAVTVVAVAAPDYTLSPPLERIWLPEAAPARLESEFGDHEYRVWGLLKPGVSPAAAAQELRAIDTPVAKANPHNGYDGRVVTRPAGDAIFGGLRSNLFTLLGAVTLVLLIACANITNLLIARAAVRRGEIAVRRALGGSRGRIVAQLLTESLLLGAAGAIAGLAVAWVGIRFLVTNPVAMPRLASATLNVPVLLFTLALTLGCTLLFGLVPSLHAARTDLQTTLRSGGRDTRGAARPRLRRALIVGELCIAQVLLVSAGLLIRSSTLVRAVPAGFDTRNLLAFSVTLPGARYRSDTAYQQVFGRISDGIAALPGVGAVGYAQVAPIYGNGWNWTVQREGSDGHDAGATGSDMRSVSTNYFTTLGLTVRRGRAFTDGDRAGAPLVAIISRDLAMKLFGTDDVVGRRISNNGAAPTAFREIVGVADDVHGNGLAHEPYPAMYMPAAQWAQPRQTFVVRGTVPVIGLTAAIRRAVASVDPELPIANVNTMERSIENLLAPLRFNYWLLGLLGGTGLILAVVGVYGVISYVVAQRTAEFGVRLALGARPADLRWLVMRQAVALAVVAVGIGVPLAMAFARLLRSFMFGITPQDPVTYVAVAATISLAALGAAYWPARRATRIAPLDALRS